MDISIFKKGNEIRKHTYGYSFVNFLCSLSLNSKFQRTQLSLMETTMSQSSNIPILPFSPLQCAPCFRDSHVSPHHTSSLLPSHYSWIPRSSEELILPLAIFITLGNARSDSDTCPLQSSLILTPWCIAVRLARTDQ